MSHAAATAATADAAADAAADAVVADAVATADPDATAAAAADDTRVNSNARFNSKTRGGARELCMRARVFVSSLRRAAQPATPASGSATTAASPNTPTGWPRAAPSKSRQTATTSVIARVR